MSFMLMAPTILTSPKVDERMKRVAQAEVAAETAAKSVADPVKSAEAAQAAKQAVLKQIEAEESESESDDDDAKGVLQTVKEAIVAIDDAVTSGLSKIDAKIGFSAAVNKVDDKLRIGDKALAVAKAADENLIRPVVFGVTRAAGAFKRKLVKKKVVVKKKSVIHKAGSPSSSSSPTSASASAATPASDLKSPELFAVSDEDPENGLEMKEMTGDHEQKAIPEDGEESEYEEVEVEEEVEVFEEVSDDEATSTSTPQKVPYVSSPRTTASAPNTSRSTTSAPNSSRSVSARSPITSPPSMSSSSSSPPTSSSPIQASSTTSPRQPPRSQPQAQSRRKSSDNASEA